MTTHHMHYVHVVPSTFLRPYYCDKCRQTVEACQMKGCQPETARVESPLFEEHCARKPMPHWPPGSKCFHCGEARSVYGDTTVVIHASGQATAVYAHGRCEVCVRQDVTGYLAEAMEAK